MRFKINIFTHEVPEGLLLVGVGDGRQIESQKLAICVGLTITNEAHLVGPDSEC